MTIRLASAMTLSLAALFSTAAMAATPAAPLKTQGGVLVNSEGRTLYTFDKDTANSGKSACTGPCVQLWPPAYVQPDAKATGKFSVVSRDDGTKQWAYDGKPVYLYVKDQKPGDKTGDNFKDIWHVVKP